MFYRIGVCGVGSGVHRVYNYTPSILENTNGEVSFDFLSFFVFFLVFDRGGTSCCELLVYSVRVVLVNLVRHRTWQVTRGPRQRRRHPAGLGRRCRSRLAPPFLLAVRPQSLHAACPHALCRHRLTLYTQIRGNSRTCWDRTRHGWNTKRSPWS